ncbi:MAG TPA: hypothetical protein ENJ54_05855 [Chloroflexi bacterium]|nr:hypothetical protein [Chloroflexota bacterium]
MPLLSPETLQAVTRKVARKFPEVRGIKPTVRREGEALVRLIYRTEAETADGHKIIRRVRVVVTPEGKILKMTTSR